MDNTFVHRAGICKSYKNLKHVLICFKIYLITMYCLVSCNEIYVPIQSQQAEAVSINCTNRLYRSRPETAIRCLIQPGCRGFWHNRNSSSALCVCPQDRWEYFALPAQAGLYLWMTTQFSKGLMSH